MAGGRRDGVGMVPVLHSEVDWEWVTSSAVVTDHGSGRMDLPHSVLAIATATPTARRSEQPPNRRGRLRQDTRPRQNTSPSRPGDSVTCGILLVRPLATVTARRHSSYRARSG